MELFINIILLKKHIMKRDCLNKFENEQDCPCNDLNCERHGICCECIKYHKNKGNLPKCLRK